MIGVPTKLKNHSCFLITDPTNKSVLVCGMAM